MDRHSPDIDFRAGIFRSARTAVNVRATIVRQNLVSAAC
jgi:hypothetical protein